MFKRLDRHIFASIMVAFILLLQLTVPTGCANQVPPLGGPRDSIPPLLVEVRPGDSSRNFNSKKIVFDFNEYVQVDNPSQNLLVSPTPKITPQVDHRLRTVTVTIKDTLEENTTYTINFGDAIKDVNEGNVLKNFTYTFSTGPVIDSLSLSGKVLMAENGKTDSTMIAALYRKGDDSVIAKEPPRYIARIDKNGNYRFRNLPAGTFYLFAFRPEGGIKVYTSKNPLAFASKPVNTAETSKADTLFAYIEEQPKTAATNNRPPVTAPKTNQAADRKLRLETNLENGEQDLLKPFEITFKQAPIRQFDSTKFHFYDGSMAPITNFTLVRDTGNTKLTLYYSWAENTRYTIIAEKDFVTDTAGRQLTGNDTLQFTTRRQSAYGALKWRFINLDLSRNPVLQLVQGDEVKYSHVFINREFNAKLFAPGDYELRILYDENKNGKWDPGIFFGKHQQPERVIVLPRKITVKANWDNESDFTL